jgi:hypothetical protein
MFNCNIRKKESERRERKRGEMGGKESEEERGMYVCMYKGWAFTALAPRPTVVYCA